MMRKLPTPIRGIGLDQVLRKYWELANLDPEITKGSITGQLKALDSLREVLVAPASQPARSTRPDGFYRPAWLPESGLPESGLEN